MHTHARATHTHTHWGGACLQEHKEDVWSLCKVMWHMVFNFIIDYCCVKV